MAERTGVPGLPAGPSGLPAQTGGAAGAPAAAADAPLGGLAGQHSGRRQLYDDEFMMWVWKVEMCKRVDKHDREQCPYAHPGELARRRHPSLYQALPCPEARAKKICPRLENCNCSHSTFEFWLHPDRYKAFLCERGEACDRPICFFAHSPDELRELPQGLQRTPAAPHRPPAAAQGSSSGGASSQVGMVGHQGAGSSSGHGYGGSSMQPQRGQLRDAATGGGPLQYYYPAGSMPAGAPAGTSRAGGGAARLDAPHRGTTVAVIPAGPSVWQNNSLLQSESGEAPNLEELCAAVTRMAMSGQPDEQAGGALALQQQQQQQQQQVGFAAPAAVPLGGQYAAPFVGMQQQGLPAMPPLPVFATAQQPQLQQAAAQVMQAPQQVLLPGGQVVYVQVPSQADMPADQLAWGGMQPRG